MKVAVYGQSDVGRKREKNEDSFLVDESLGLFIVADGMGGHLGGEYASRLAVRTVEETLRQLTQDPEATISSDFTLDDTEVRSDPGEQLKYALRLASQKIFEEANRNPNLRGMGTTSVVLLIRDGKGFIANVGDSRAYLIRDQEVRQLTSDHSLVAEQLRAGFITEEEIKHHKFKNIITRSVGFQTDVEIDLLVRDLEEGDRILLCSDGLTNLVDDSEILRIVSKNGPKAACQKLVDLANKNGGDDNVTVVIAAVD